MNLNQPLLAHEIGSLAKPNWRVKALRNRPLEDPDIEEARTWLQRLDLAQEGEALLDLLAKRKNFSPEERKTIVVWSSKMATRLLEKAGLDVVYDGEQHRVEMYEYPIRRTQGFHFLGHVRSFDNKYYRKAAVVERPSLPHPYHLEEYQTIASFAHRPVKIPITGAYTLVDWSFDEFYMKNVPIGTARGLSGRKEARRAFLLDMARHVIYPNLKALADMGATFLQIDEPAATTHPDEIPLFVEATKESVQDLKDRVFFGMHICFSDYSVLFPLIRDLEGVIHEMHFEYANRDSRETGVSPEQRPGYAILHLLKPTQFVVGLGVLDVHTNFVEPPELVRDRILFAIDTLQDPQRIFVAPDCGLRTRSWDIAYQKLRNMVEGIHLAREKAGLS